jgi:hypothetical protein
VLSRNPADVVIGPADLPAGFAVATEYPTSRVDLWLARPRLAQSTIQVARTTAPQDTAIGLHLLLTRINPTHTDGLIALASTALHYEVTVLAAQAFTTQVDSLPTARNEPMLRDVLVGDDEARHWRFHLSGAVVDQILLHTRNYVLAVIVVQRPGSEAHSAITYIQTMRSRVQI